MTPSPSVTCLDIRLQPSRLRLVSWLVMALALTALIGLLPLALGYRMGLVAVLAGCCILSQLLSKQLLALATVNPLAGKLAHLSHLSDIEWQLQWVQGYLRPPWGCEQAMYEASLEAIHHHGPVMLLIFVTTGSAPKRHQFVIWQDQIGADSWRKLAVLAQ